MNYREMTEYIEEIPKFTSKNPLDHTKEFLKRMGNPQNKMKVIHVAGTNGKGSVCAYLDSMLREGGHHVGLFTSPHLVVINERFKIDGVMVSDDKLLEAFEKVLKIIQDAKKDGLDHPSYFETLFLMGMIVFLEAGVEYLILETGLGGRLDATNTVDHPLACIIASISIDHVEYLGNTIPEIAGEKAGIIKSGTPVIFDGHVPEASEVIKARAIEKGSPYFELAQDMYHLDRQTKDGIDFTFRGEKLSIPYIASYQMMNASLAFYTMKILEEDHKIPEEVLIRGLKKTRWEGRMETILPGVVVDGAHNRDGVRRFVETARFFGETSRIVLLFSAVADKEYEEMIHTVSTQIRPYAVVTTQIDGNRVVPAEKLAQLFQENGCEKVIAEPCIGRAFDTAYQLKGDDGMMFCVGSLYLVGEIKGYLAKKQNQERI